MRVSFNISRERQEKLVAETIQMVKDFINESQTISSVVVRITSKISSQLKEEYRKADVQVTNDGSKIRRGIFSYEEYGFSLFVKWYWKNLPLKSHSYDEISETARMDAEAKELFINVISVNGKYYPNSLNETLQHEIYHLFERQKRGKEYKNMTNYKIATSTFNKLATTDAITEEETHERLISGCIASIVYMAYRFEQRAFYNGAYQYIMTSERDAYFNFDELLRETRLFRRLMDVKFCMDELSTIDPKDSFLLNELKKYKLTLGEVLKYGKNLIYRLEKMIIRLKDKVMTDTTDKMEAIPYPEPYSPQNEKSNKSPKIPIEEILKKYLI